MASCRSLPPRWAPIRRTLGDFLTCTARFGSRQTTGSLPTTFATAPSMTRRGQRQACTTRSAEARRRSKRMSAGVRSAATPAPLMGRTLIWTHGTPFTAISVSASCVSGLRDQRTRPRLIHPYLSQVSVFMTIRFLRVRIPRSFPLKSMGIPSRKPKTTC